MTAQNKAVVLLSGGMDSTTCLAMTLAEGYECVALSFNYGQKSRSELNAAQRVAKAYDLDHRIIELDNTSLLSSSLTQSNIEVPTGDAIVADEIPSTYVPARNTLFLSYALGLAEVIDADRIVFGANALDYSGYPDCRPEFVEAFQRVMNAGTKRGVEGRPIELTAPLMQMTKAQIVQQAVKLGVDLSLTVSCYQADDEGRACGVCDSCVLRRKGFEAAGIKDATLYRAAFAD